MTCFLFRAMKGKNVAYCFLTHSLVKTLGSLFPSLGSLHFPGASQMRLLAQRQDK